VAPEVGIPQDMGACGRRSTVCCGFCDDCPHLLRRLDQVRIVKVGVAGGGPVPPVPEQLSDQGQALARHDGLAGRRVAEVVQAQSAELGIVADSAPAIAQRVVALLIPRSWGTGMPSAFWDRAGSRSVPARLPQAARRAGRSSSPRD